MKTNTWRSSSRRKVVAGVAVAGAALLALTACTTDTSGSAASTSAAPGTCATSAKGSAASTVSGVADAQKIVDRASLPSTDWDGPTGRPQGRCGHSRRLHRLQRVQHRRHRRLRRAQGSRSGPRLGNHLHRWSGLDE